jgi:3-hydroxy-9,10-secoandrosta-1,3,5(10)-triene-9,17-dione monooxygenase
MKGTSSNDIVIDGAFVPEHRTVNALDFMDGRSPGAALHANPFYSLPVLPFILGEVVPVVVGAYCGAAAEFKRLTEVRQSAHTATKVSTRQTAQIRIARGLSGAALAEGMLDDYVSLLATADPRYLRDPLVRASIKARCSLITEYCAEGINELMLGAGADAHRSSSPMQRYFRDINMLRVHGFLDLESACENYGRMLLGLTPIAPI